MGLELCPITQKEAFAFVERHHRHHKPPAGSLFQIGLALDAALEYFARSGCVPTKMKWDDSLLSQIARKAQSTGDLPVAFQCSRLACLVRERRPGGRSLGLRSTFVHLDPQLELLLSGGARDVMARGEGWFDDVSEAWRKVPPLKISPEASAFAEKELKRIEKGGPRLSRAKLLALLGDEKEAIGALASGEAELPDEEWQCLCRLLVLWAGDPRVLTPNGPQLKALGLPPDVTQAVSRLLKENDPQGKLAAAIRKEFLSEALEGAQLALRRAAKEKPEGRAKLLASFLGTPLFPRALSHFHSEELLTDEVLTALRTKVSEA